jgi:hypothetical protein
MIVTCLECAAAVARLGDCCPAHAHLYEDPPKPANSNQGHADEIEGDQA